MSAATKTEIRTFARRATRASRKIHAILNAETRWLSDGTWTEDEIAKALASWAEEFAGSAAHVQELIERRYKTPA